MQPAKHCLNDYVTFTYWYLGLSQWLLEVTLHTRYKMHHQFAHLHYLNCLDCNNMTENEQGTKQWRNVTIFWLYCHLSVAAQQM